MQIKELQILYRGIIIIKANKNDTTRRMTDMKILVFEMRDDEAQAVRRQAEKLHITVDTTSEVPSLQNVDFVKGYDGISVLGQGQIIP